MLSIFGTISNPTNIPSVKGSGFFTFLSTIFKFAGVVAGIIMVVQIIMAGFDYMSASGDPKKTEAAGIKIWNSVLGLIIVASAFLIAGIVGRLTGIDIINPTIQGPINSPS